jgi:hypothetical protein
VITRSGSRLTSCSTLTGGAGAPAELEPRAPLGVVLVLNLVGKLLDDVGVA